MKPFLFIALLFMATKSFAQNRIFFSNQFYFLSEQPLKNKGGHKFRYSADLKSVAADTLSHITIRAVQMGVDNADYLQTHDYQNVHQDTLWHTASVEGQLTAKTQKIWLYVIQQGNGSFYVDNMKLELQEPDGSWLNIPIKNGDFETEYKDPLKGLIKNAKMPQGTSVDLVNLTDKNSKGILIKGSGGQPIERIPYGNNGKNGQYCAVNGINLYYETYGEGQPILLLHGNGQSISSFSKQIPALSKKYNVIAVDTRAQGRSIDGNSDKLTYELFASDMKTLLDSLQLKKVNVLGWSDGGNTALIMAIKYPEYVDKVMVMGANLNPSAEAVESNILKQANKDLKKLSTVDTKEARQTTKLLNLILTEPNIPTGDLERITAKVLVMAGEKDLIKEAHTKLIAQHIKGAQLKIFKGASHFIPEEDANTFNNEVLQFLQN